MNGQPSSQNTRETGANGMLPGFRNWHNEQHVEALAGFFNVEPLRVPHWAPPTHAMEIFRYAEQGSLRFLWIQCTNPAVSLPELGRIRSILRRNRLFVVVQDAWLTETAALADVVLPAAIWGEKTGCVTNADRTVHLARKVVDPPGEARPDLEIFLDYATRMDLRDRDGDPLLPWRDAAEVWQAFTRVTAGRTCDQTGITHERLRTTHSLRWPCPEGSPDVAERLYADGVFPTDPDFCERYGHDLETGAEIQPEAYRAANPAGRAILKAARYLPPDDGPSAEYPFLLEPGAPSTTGTPGRRPRTPGSCRRRLPRPGSR